METNTKTKNVLFSVKIAEKVDETVQRVDETAQKEFSYGQY
jgi:hypothetical protein